jgi:hypothetical protein
MPYLSAAIEHRQTVRHILRIKMTVLTVPLIVTDCPSPVRAATAFCHRHDIPPVQSPPAIVGRTSPAAVPVRPPSAMSALLFIIYQIRIAPVMNLFIINASPCIVILPQHLSTSLYFPRIFCINTI